MISQRNGPRVGNNVVNLPSNGLVKNLFGQVTASGNFDTFKDSVGGAAYQVPVGKKFIILQVAGSVNAAAAMIYCGIGYGDTAVTNSGPAPTNEIGVSVQAYLLCNNTGLGIETSTYIEVPAGKYPACKPTGAATAVRIVGVEVNA